MAARKTTTKPAAHDVADVEAKPPRRPRGRHQAQITNAIEQSREESRERMLAGLGLIARARQARGAHGAGRGRQALGKVKQAIEDLKTKSCSQGRRQVRPQSSLDGRPSIAKR